MRVEETHVGGRFALYTRVGVNDRSMMCAIVVVVVVIGI